MIVAKTQSDLENDQILESTNHYYINLYIYYHFYLLWLRKK